MIDLDVVQNWLLDAGKIALSRSADRSVAIKADRTPVTQLDNQIEAFLLEKISSQYPEHGVLAEEGSSRTGAEFTWIIDPIDGTRAFASGLPVWGISVGVFYRGEPYAGVFYLPMTGEMFWASQERAFYNDQEFIATGTVDLNSSLAFIAVPSNAHRHFEISFPRLRSLGSTTAHLAYVAYGKATAAITRQVRIWDMAAVLPALKLAQVQLVYLSGRPFQPGELLDGRLTPEPVLAAHSSVISEVRACIKSK